MKNLFLCTLFTISIASTCSAQTDFFMSLNALNSGAVNSELSAEFNPGDSGSIYIYYTTNGPADSDISTGAFLDIVTSADGVVEFTAAETLDFSVTLFGSPVGVRWGDSFGDAFFVGGGLVDELGAFTIFSGAGMIEAHDGSTGVLDQGYDAGADAFLFAKIEFTVAIDAAAGSSVDLLMTSGSGLIINNGIEIVPATFGGATISVAADEVLGDVNGDGVVSMADVGPFVQLIINDEFMSAADINQDGVVNLLDVRPFVKLLKP